MKPQSPHYLRDPKAIYKLSFERVWKSAKLDRFDPGAAEMAMRIIHACGMPDIAGDLVASPRVMERASAALEGGAPVLCDCAMVAAGITRRYLPSDNRIVVTIDDPEAEDRARELGTTRSAAAVEGWRENLDGAVVAIGNAPTALFHLMELLEQGWPKPAVILGFPVGFVGAADSKEWLAMHAPDMHPPDTHALKGVEFITLKGTRGGSAMAAAAVNAAAIRASRNAEENADKNAGGNSDRGAGKMVDKKVDKKAVREGRR